MTWSFPVRTGSFAAVITTPTSPTWSIFIVPARVNPWLRISLTSRSRDLQGAGAGVWGLPAGFQLAEHPPHVEFVPLFEYLAVADGGDVDERDGDPSPGRYEAPVGRGVGAAHGDPGRHAVPFCDLILD